MGCQRHYLRFTHQWQIEHLRHLHQRNARQRQFPPPPRLLHVSLQRLPQRHFSSGPEFLSIFLLSRPRSGTLYISSPHCSSGYARRPCRLSKFAISLCSILHLLHPPPYSLQACSSFLLAGSYERPYGGCAYVGYSYQLPRLLGRILISTLELSLPITCTPPPL